MVTALRAARTAHVSHTLAWPWVAAGIVVLAVIVILVARWWVRRASQRRPHDATWVAHTAALLAMPAFRTWLRRYRLWQWFGIGSLTVALVGAGALAARPLTIEVTQSVLGTRDIVLCLDVSGSMLEYNQQMVDVFRELVEHFDGERIALSIFNETSRSVFPLTDDYALIEKQLDEASAALDPRVIIDQTPELVDEYLYFTAGTMRNHGDSSSLIGDGLASCALQFDTPELDVADAAPSGDGSAPTDDPPKRSRSIILATDNDLRGTPVYTLTEAVELASSLDVDIDALYGTTSWITDPHAEEGYRTAVTAAGGHFYRADDAAAVPAIVERVQAQQAIDLAAAPEVTKTDSPQVWFFVLLIGVAGLVLAAWRVRE